MKTGLSSSFASWPESSAVDVSDLPRWQQRVSSAIGVARVLPRAFRIVMDAAPRESTGLAGVTVLSGAVPIALLALTKLAVDGVAAVLTGGVPDGWHRALLFVLALACLVLLAEVLSAVTAWLRLGQSERVSIRVRGMAQEQSSRVAMRFLEDPEYFDKLHRAREGASERPAQIVDGMAELARAGIALVGVMLLLSIYAWWLPLLLVVAMLPSLFNVLANARRQHRFEVSTTADERLAAYFDWLLTSRQAAAEMRVFSLAPHFRARFADVREKIRQGRMRLLRAESFARILLAGVGLAAAGAAVIWMLHRTVHGDGTLGDVALCYQAFVQGSTLARGALTSLGLVYRNSLLLEDFLEFLALPRDPPVDGHGENSSPVPDSPSASLAAPLIRFESVSFQYPGSRRKALDGLTLELPSGSVVAILGPNGAGKSTMVKLLCRFHEPDTGTIWVDGLDAREINPEEMRRSVSVLFQDALELSGTLAANVLPLTPEDEPRVESAVRAAQAEALVAGLPEGIRTRLAVWFSGGTDLSGGEWQRVAVARSFARPAPILVLDEPTSAMDPWAEREWLVGLREHARGRTVVLITHRLTTAAAADIIHVLDEGRVVESGSHDSLRVSRGAYARLWEERVDEVRFDRP